VATFSAQVVDLVGAFSDETALDSFITEGANEVINAMPRSMRERVAEETSFTNTTSSEGSKVLHVLRNDGTIDQPCRRIPARHRGRIQDSSDMQYATTSDPAFYIQDALVTIFPTGTGKLVSIPTYNQGSALDASSLSTITNFPNEAEYLVTLYAAIKALQQNMTGKLGNSSITTALNAITTELGETQAIADKIDADLVLAKAEVVLAKTEAAEIASNTDNASGFETACDAMVTELNKVDEIINLANDEFDEVSTQVNGSKDSPITDAFNEFEKSDTLLDKGEVDSESAVNDAAAKIVIELDDTRAICDDVGDRADSAFTALGNMATEMALANAEVDGVTTTLAQALVLTDSGSTDIATALDGMQTANAKFRADNSNPGLFGDAEWFTTGANVGMTKVKLAVDNAISLIGLSTAGDKYAAAYDLESNMLDIDTELTNEDVELANGRMQQAQTQMKAVATHLSVAQSHIAEWNATVQTLVSEINAFSSEASARYGWVSAKAVAWQGKLAAAQGYMATAGGYANQANGFNSTAQTYATEAQTRIGLASGYIAEINGRLAQANAKRQESQSRLTAGSAYLQEAQSTVAAGNAYLQEAQGRISQAQGYANEVSARSSFAGAKSQAVQGHISTAQSYVATAQGFSGEIQSKIGIAQGYASEVQSRLAVDTTEYSWYEKQQAKLQVDYDKGIQLLAKG
jgi:hypothetical protein